MTIFLCSRKSVPLFATTSYQKALSWMRDEFITLIETGYTFVKKTENSYSLIDLKGNDTDLSITELTLQDD